MEQNQIVLRKEDFTEQSGMLYMPIRELARRLGYKEARRLKNLYYRHKDELSMYAMVTTVGTIQGDRETIVLSELGCYAIAMLSETPKAKEFRKALAKLIVDLRKQNLHLVSAEIVEQIKKELSEEKLKSLNWRTRYYQASKELKIRKMKGINFTNAKIIDNLNSKRYSVENISEITGIETGRIRVYLTYSLAASESEKDLKRTLNGKYPPSTMKERNELIFRSDSSLTKPINYFPVVNVEVDDEQA